MSGPPPPPPPHGNTPKSSGLPDGKYDIFVIPPHSAGGGFLYLPSLQPNVNSFVAGFACALFLVVIGQSMAPAFRAWWDSFHGLGNMGIALLMLAIGFGAWSLGRTQKPESYHGAGPGSGSGDRSGSDQRYAGSYGSHPSPEQDGQYPPPPGSSPPPPGGATPPPGQDKYKHQRQQHRAPPSPEPQPGKTKAESAKGSWEKAREEMRRKEEERKAKEAEQKRREETQRRLAELRAKEAREREEREKEKNKREEEARTRKDKAEAEAKAKDQAAQQARERLEREAKARQQREQRERELKEAKAKEATQKKASADDARKGSSYAFSGIGEKTSMWPNGRPAVPPHASPSATSSGSPRKPPAPTARTYVSTEDDMHSYRPYDQRKARRKSFNSADGSEASWAASQTTARTSPPPSFRGPYSTKDPDKIVIQAVYLFMNQFAKTPASQLISGVGSVTDGLILRITTEGLFIDDDVRGVPQREWDVKAWTLKLVEVWCPPHCLNASSASSSGTGTKNNPSMFAKLAGGGRDHRERGGNSALTGEEADQYLTEMLYACKNCCRLGLCDRKLKDTNIPSSAGQTGEWKSKGLHILRATVRDQEGKKYIFVLDETEAWKVAVGVQRLRRGTQVRQLGVTGISPTEAREALETLGWSG